MNPVRLTDSAQPADAANAGFLVFVEGDVSLGGDESEGTVAAGGNLTFTTSYNVAANVSNTFTTPTAPGDSRPIGLYVAGGITWPTNGSILRVLNQQFTKVVGTTSYTAHVTDANGALSNYRLTDVDDAYDSTPRIEGTSNQQTVELDPDALRGHRLRRRLHRVPGGDDRDGRLRPDLGADQRSGQPAATTHPSWQPGLPLACPGPN